MEHVVCSDASLINTDQDDAGHVGLDNQVSNIYVVPQVFEDDPMAVRTFDASGEEAGQL